MATQSWTKLTHAMYHHRDDELERVVMGWGCQCSRWKGKTMELRLRKCGDNKKGGNGHVSGFAAQEGDEGGKADQSLLQKGGRRVGGFLANTQEQKTKCSASMQSACLPPPPLLYLAPIDISSSPTQLALHLAKFTRNRLHPIQVLAFRDIDPSDP